MAPAALALYLVYLAIAFGLRTAVHWFHAGSSGFKPASRGVGYA